MSSEHDPGAPPRRRERLIRLLAKDSPASWLLLLVVVTMALALTKGFARAVHPYAVSQYMYTYEHGFLVRALPGQLIFWLCDEAPVCLSRSIEWVGTSSVLAFSVILFLVVHRQTRGSPSGLLALAFVASGPLLVQIGAGRGYHDALVLAVGLLSYDLYVSGRLIPALCLFVVGVLSHELVSAYVLPLFLLPILAGSSSRKALLQRIIVVLSLAIATFGIVKLGQSSRAQRVHLTEKLQRTSPELSRGWRGYTRSGVVAATKRADRPTTKYLRVALQPRYRRYLFPLAMMAVLATGILISKGRASQVPFYLAIMLSPLIILFYAWDVDRLVSLAGTTAVVVCGELMRRFDIRRVPTWVAVGALPLLVGQLLSHYDVTDRYARGKTLLGLFVGDDARPGKRARTNRTQRSQ